MQPSLKSPLLFTYSPFKSSQLDKSWRTKVLKSYKYENTYCLVQVKALDIKRRLKIFSYIGVESNTLEYEPMKTVK